MTVSMQAKWEVRFSSSSSLLNGLQGREKKGELMFRALHEKRKSEEGFTLIELLVVILIIAILAAIAIPVFLNQRNKGYVAQAESALKNAATNMESYATGNDGAYPTDDAAGKEALVSEGFRDVDKVTLTIADSSSTGFCLEADHELIGEEAGSDYFWSSDAGKPEAGSCTP